MRTSWPPSDVPAGAPGAQRALEAGQLVRHRAADIELRVGRRAHVFLFLAFGDAGARLLERLDERVLEMQRLLEERFGEEGRVAVGAAPERRAIGRRRRHDQRVVVLQRLHLAARIASRDDDGAPLYTGVN